MELMTKSREKWIDNAKGLAILLVIIGHVSGGLSGISFQFVYGIHLVMFFLISGYTLKKKDLTCEYVAARFSRLMVPYFYTCFAVLITDVFNCHFLFHDSSIQTVTSVIGKDLIRSFFASGSITSFGPVEIGTRIGAVWFLPAMFFAQMIFQSLLSWTEDDRKLGFCTAGIGLAAYLTARFLWLPFSIQSGMLASFFLWIGYEIRKHNILSKVRWYHYLAAQVCLLFGIAFGYCNIGFVVASLNDLFFSVPVGLSGCLLIYLISKGNKKGIVLSYIGKISLTVMCVHLYALETMGIYVNLILDKAGLSGNSRAWILIIIEILFACVIAATIEFLKTWYARRRRYKSSDLPVKLSENRRDPTIDIAKGIFICAMLISQFAIDRTLRNIIYSCHTMAFVIFSGYFYKENRPIGSNIQKMTKTFLLPYVVFVAGVFLLDCSRWSPAYFAGGFKKYLLGMSYARKLFPNAESVGPVFFILMLFVTRAIYSLLAAVTANRKQLTVAVVLVSVLGVIMGKREWWLPWSIDIACYSLIFYHLGRLCREKNVLEQISKRNYVYFLLSPVWAYMIYAGSMEIIARNYGNYGLVLLGAMSGTLLVYQLSSYISDHISVFAKVLSYLGEASIYILIIHVLLEPRIGEHVSKFFDREYTAFMIFTALLQLILAIAVKASFDLLKGKGRKTRKL